MGMDEHGEAILTSTPDVYRISPLNPVTEGHMLFVHRDHFVRAEDGGYASTQTLEALLCWAKERRQDYNIIQSNGSDATQTIQHVHFHFVPRRKGDGIALPWDR